MKSLTIGRRVSLGFALLLLLAAVIGGIAFVQAGKTASRAHSLDAAYAPQMAHLADTIDSFGAATLAMRTYGLTGEEAQYQATLKGLKATDEALQAAQSLAEAQEDLAADRKELATARELLGNYAKAVEATAVLVQDRIRLRESMDVAGFDYQRETGAYIASMEKAFESEAAEGLSAEKMMERLNKVVIGGALRNHGNQVRLIAAKAQARGDLALLDEADTHFTAIETLIEKVRPLTRQAANQKQLEVIQRSAEAYKRNLAALRDGEAKLAQLRTERTAIYDGLQARVDRIHTDAIKQVDVMSGESLAAAQLSQRSVAVTFGIAMVLGLGAAWLITWTINRRLRSVCVTLENGALQLATAAAQVSSASQASADGTSEQAAGLEESAATLDEISGTTKRTSEHALTAKSMANEARGAAEVGANDMREMTTAINEIQEAADRVAKIVKTIEDIAFQTNILALNAAVEAARAGDAGLGFSVVADEVRSLARRCATAAEESATRIEDAHQKSLKGVAICSRVAAGFGVITEKARAVDEVVAEISEATKEQSTGIQQIHTAFAQMSQVTQAGAAQSEECAAAAQSLDAQASDLRGAVADLSRLVEGAAAGAVPSAAAIEGDKTPAIENPVLSVAGSIPARKKSAKAKDASHFSEVG